MGVKQNRKSFLTERQPFLIATLVDKSLCAQVLITDMIGVTTEFKFVAHFFRSFLN